MSLVFSEVMPVRVLRFFPTETPVSLLLFWGKGSLRNICSTSRTFPFIAPFGLPSMSSMRRSASEVEKKVTQPVAPSGSSKVTTSVLKTLLTIDIIPRRYSVVASGGRNLILIPDSPGQGSAMGGRRRAEFVML